MDPQLEAELRQVMARGGMRAMADSVKQYGWLLLMAEARETPNLKAHLMSHVLCQGEDYAAATLTAALLQARGIVHELASTPDPKFGNTMDGPNDDHSDGARAAHIYVSALLNVSSHTEGKAISHEMTETLKSFSPEDKGGMCMHFLSLVGELVAMAYEIREEQAAEAVGKAEDEGDSRS